MSMARLRLQRRQRIGRKRLEHLIPVGWQTWNMQVANLWPNLYIIGQIPNPPRPRAPQKLSF